ncbi:hypothetical protein V8E53_000849 [Lactarius tabidus]
MMDQHRRPTLSHKVVQCFPQSSWNLAPMGGLAHSTQPWDLLVSDASISGIGSPSLSMTHQHENSSYPPIVGETDRIVEMDKPLLKSPPNHRTTLYPSHQTSVPTAHQRPLATLYSLPNIFPRPQTKIKAPDDQFEVQMDYIAARDRAPKVFYARVNVDTPQFPPPIVEDQNNGSQAIAVAVGISRDERRMTEEAHAPMMSFGGTPLSDDCSCSPTCSTRGATMLNATPQEANEASQRHSEGEHLGGLDQALYTTPNRTTGVEEMVEKPYQCHFCRVSFSQRQGLTRHSKDKHSPKNRCGFCVKFTWSKGRRYVYRKHLQEEHPGFESIFESSVCANSIRCRRGVKLKGQHFCKNSIARRTT